MSKFIRKFTPVGIITDVLAGGPERREQAKKQEQREGRATKEAAEEAAALKKADVEAADKAKKAVKAKRKGVTRTILTKGTKLTEEQTGLKTVLGA